MKKSELKLTAEQVAEKERVKKEVAKFVYELRISLRETQKEFAERFWLSAGMIPFYEKGKTMPPLDIFIQMVKLAGKIPYPVFGVEEPARYIIVEPKDGFIKIPAEQEKTYLK